MFTEILLSVIAVLLCLVLIYLNALAKRIAKHQHLQPKDLGRKRSPYKRLQKQPPHSNGFSRELIAEIKDRIIKETAVNENYTDPNFKLEDLAKLIGLPKHQASKIINQEFGVDFNSFINKMRIDKAKELFLSQDDFQISDVMYDVGFNNSTTFNRAFKKYSNNLTPTDFLASYSELYVNS
jgi:YesN/AraC family two-component response regulator